MQELHNTFKKGDIMNIDKLTDILTAIAAVLTVAVVFIAIYILKEV